MHTLVDGGLCGRPAYANPILIFMLFDGHQYSNPMCLDVLGHPTNVVLQLFDIHVVLMILSS